MELDITTLNKKAVELKSINNKINVLLDTVDYLRVQAEALAEEVQEERNTTIELLTDSVDDQVEEYLAGIEV